MPHEPFESLSLRGVSAHSRAASHHLYRHHAYRADAPRASSPQLQVTVGPLSVLCGTRLANAFMQCVVSASVYLATSFEVSAWSRDPYFTPVYDQMAFHRVDRPQPVCPFSRWGTSRPFLLLALVYSAAMNIRSYTSVCLNTCLQFSWA